MHKLACSWGIAWAVLFATIPSVTALAQGTVVIMRTNDANNYDPQRTGTRAGTEIIAMLSDSLVAIAPDMKTIEPDLAESWTVQHKR